MVDLVKLRRKAKKESGQRAAGSGQAGEAAPLAQAPGPEPAGIELESGRRVAEEVPALASSVTAPAPTPDTRHPAPADAKLAQFRENAGKKREGFIEEEAATSAGDQVELLTFVLAGEQYAVSIDHIVEIVTPRPATHIPNADRSIVGIMSLRGTIVTVVDVRQKLGHHPRPGSSDTRTIVAERNGETLGFEVDRVLRVLKVGAAAIEPHPVVHASEQSDAIRGVFRHANALTILLDLDKLLA
jgi:purine-binding chemotaxis protein CheW